MRSKPKSNMLGDRSTVGVVQKGSSMNFTLRLIWEDLPKIKESCASSFVPNKCANLEDSTGASIISPVPHELLGAVNVSLHSIVSNGGRD